MTTSTTQSDIEKWTNPLRNPRDMRLPRIAGPCSLVIFGVTGDLSKKKLIPAVYDLANRGLLPAGFGLVGLVGPLASIDAGLNVGLAVVVWLVVPVIAALATKFVYENVLKLYDSNVVFKFQQ